MYKIISTTTDSKKNAKEIIDDILSKNLSPCIQLIDGVQSYYKWDEDVEDSLEYLILIKCTPDNEDMVKECILKLHHYEVPELISSDFNILNPDYEKWFSDNSM